MILSRRGCIIRLGSWGSTGTTTKVLFLKLARYTARWRQRAAPLLFLSFPYTTYSSRKRRGTKLRPGGGRQNTPHTASRPSSAPVPDRHGRAASTVAWRRDPDGTPPCTLHRPECGERLFNQDQDQARAAGRADDMQRVLQGVSSALPVRSYLRVTATLQLRGTRARPLEKGSADDDTSSPPL